MDVKKLKLFQTCFACPEQYDVYYNDALVGYIRYRHGIFSVNPVINGNYDFTNDLMIFTTDDDSGILSETQRKELLPQALQKIAEFHTK